jgi:hypothetical protein
LAQSQAAARARVDARLRNAVARTRQRLQAFESFAAAAALLPSTLSTLAALSVAVESIGEQTRGFERYPRRLWRAADGVARRTTRSRRYSRQSVSVVVCF